VDNVRLRRFVSTHFGSSKSLRTQVGHAFELIDFAQFLRRQALPSATAEEPTVESPSLRSPSAHSPRTSSPSDQLGGARSSSPSTPPLSAEAESTVDVDEDVDVMISAELVADVEETDGLINAERTRLRAHAHAHAHAHVHQHNDEGVVNDGVDAAVDQANGELVEVVIAGDLNSPSFSTVLGVLVHYFEDAWSTRGSWPDALGTTHASVASFLPRLLRSDYVLLYKVGCVCVCVCACACVCIDPHILLFGVLVH
jgi:hypothetical protein